MGDVNIADPTPKKAPAPAIRPRDEDETTEGKNLQDPLGQEDLEDPLSSAAPATSEEPGARRSRA